MPAENQSLEEVLFDLAVQKPTAEERAAFLDSVCQDNPGLRASLEELLEGHFGAGGFLPKPQPPEPPPANGASEPTEDPPPAQRIGPYKRLEKLGEGGFGEVWMAEQREPIKRRVALKIIKLGMDTRQVIARFEAERQALAMMDHPNIARVFDAGATDTGRPYFAMELVRGIRITDYCDQNQLTTEERLKLFVLVCQAIQHAHQKGIIHRDIKPSNVLVTLHDGVPVPKVIDFGIAKATQQELTDKTVFTHFQQFVGTPAYISPEQAEMSGLDVDTRSDIYSLGVLLYELLVGRTPLDAAELTRGGLDALRKAIREEEPLRPSNRLRTLHDADRTATARHRRTDPPALTHLLNGDLDWIAMKALEKDRTRRYATANGFAMDIQRYLDNHPVTAVPPSKAYLIRKYVRRHRTAIVVAMVIAALLVTGTVVSNLLAVQARRAQQAAEQARTAESEQRQLAQQKQAEAEAAQALAETEQTRAEAGEQELSDLLYATKMNFAQSAFEQLNFARVRQLLDETRTHPKRGPEWAFWQSQMHPEVRQLIGHVGPVYRVVFAPDGRRLATAGEDWRVIIWDAATGEEMVRADLYDAERPGERPQYEYLRLSFSLDGRWILVNLVESGDLRLLDAATGEPHLRLRGEKGGDFSPNSREFATFKGRFVRFWDIASGHLLRAFQAGNPQMVRYRPDGRSFLMRDSGWHVIRDAATGQVIHTLSTKPDRWVAEYGVAALSPNGALMAVAGRFGDATTLWDAAATDVRVATLPRASNDEPALAFSPDSTKLLIASSDRTVRLWEATGRTELRRFDGHTALVLDVAFSPEGRWIASASDDGTARIWDLNSKLNPLVKDFGESTDIGASSVSPDGRWVVTGHTAGLTIWDPGTGETRQTITVVPRPERPADARIESVSFSPDGNRILASGWNGEVIVFDAWTGERHLTLRPGDPIIPAASFSPDGTKIVTGSRSQGFRVWDAADGSPLLTLSEKSRDWQAAEFSADGGWIVTADQDATQVWDAATGRPLHRLPAPDSDFHAIIAISEDGSRIATSGVQQRVTVWNPETGEATLTLSGHKEVIASVEFTRDGLRILTGSRDGTARLWDATTGRELLSLVGHTGAVASARFFPDGNRILTASWDHTARIWSIATPDQVGAWQWEEEVGARRVAARIPEAEARQQAASRAAERRRSAMEREEQELATWSQKASPAPRHQAVPYSPTAKPPASSRIRQWLVLSPIPYEGIAPLAVFRDPLPNPSQLHPRAGDRVRVGDHDLAWTAVQMGDQDERLDFLALASRQGPADTDSQLAYAATYLWSDARRTGLAMRIQCDDVGRLYLNGREVYRQTETHRPFLEEDQIDGIELKEGRNTIVFKVASRIELWTSSVMLLDAGGQPVDGIRVSLDPSMGSSSP